MKGILSKIFGSKPVKSAPVRKALPVRSRCAKNYLDEAFSYTGYAQHGADRDGGSLDRWCVFASSPRDDCDKNLPVLRKRSRDLYMSSSFFGSILHAKRDGVIGRGLELDAKIDAEMLGLSTDEAAVYEHRIEAAFRRFSRNVGTDGSSFNEVLQAAYFASILSGDVLAVLYCDAERRRVRVQLIESDCVATPPECSNDRRVRSGIELRDDGIPRAYWTADGYEHNLDGDQITYNRRQAFLAGYQGLSGEWIPPRPGAILVHTPFERPGQLRGLPICSRVISDMKQLDRYMKAELDASVAASKPALFRRHPAVEAVDEVNYLDSFGDSVGPLAGDEQQSASSMQCGCTEPPIDYGNGLMIDLWDGADMQAFNPLRPNASYAQFVDHKFSEIAANLGMSAEVALKKWNASYSASRAALLDAQQGFEIDRARFINQLVRPLYNVFLDMHADELGLFGYYTDPEKRDAWRCAEWIGEQLPNIDPTKEIDAAAKRVALGVSTLSREAQIATGTDVLANIRQRGYEERLLKEYGLVKDQNGNPISPDGREEQ